MSDTNCVDCLRSKTLYSVVCNQGHVCPFYKMNPFIIFQMTPSLNIDRKLLDQRYFDFQRLLHPDKLRHASVEVQDWADRHISQINQAYKALQNILLIAKATALYIQNPTLELSEFNDKDIPMVDSDFLSTIVSLQAQGNSKNIAELYHKITVDLDKSIRELNLSGVLNSIARLTYVERLRNLG